jgi:hypothetical protein
VTPDHGVAAVLPGTLLVGLGLTVARALVAALFVSDHPSGAPQMVPSPRVHGCVLPVGEPALTSSETS